MLILEGTNKGVIHTPESVNRETGEMIAASDRVQVEVAEVTKTGDVKYTIYTLKTDTPEPMRKLVGKPVRIPVGMMVQNGKAALYGLPTQRDEKVA